VLGSAGLRPPGKFRKPWHTHDPADELAGDKAELRIHQMRIHDPRHAAVNRNRPVESESRRIQELRAEDVLLVKCDELPPRHDIRQQPVHGVRLDLF